MIKAQGVPVSLVTLLEKVSKNLDKGRMFLSKAKEMNSEPVLIVFFLQTAKNAKILREVRQDYFAFFANTLGTSRLEFTTVENN